MSAEVKVWTARLPPSPADLAALERQLSPDERERAQRFHRRTDRDRFVAAHALLREILASETGAGAAALDIRTRDDGKPSLSPDRNLRFNLSHSGEFALFAVARDREVGVDVERVRADVDLEALAPRVLSPPELDRWLGLPAGERRDAFFTAWTRKEAYAKARGVGLTLELGRIEIGPEAAAGAGLHVHEDGVERPWRVRDIDFAAGYVAAVSAQREDWVLRLQGVDRASGAKPGGRT